MSLQFAFQWHFLAASALQEECGADFLQASFLSRVRSMSSHCSGLGTAELSMRFLAVALRRLNIDMFIEHTMVCAWDSDTC